MIFPGYATERMLPSTCIDRTCDFLSLRAISGGRERRDSGFTFGPSKRAPTGVRLGIVALLALFWPGVKTSEQTMEIKASSAPAPEGVVQLSWLRKQLGSKVHAAIVLHTGARSYRLAERAGDANCQPMDALNAETQRCSRLGACAGLSQLG
jgi:hypothetical protein